MYNKNVTFRHIYVNNKTFQNCFTSLARGEDNKTPLEKNY